MTLGVQVVWLVVLSLAVGCAAWTVTHEELFREPREYCVRRSEVARTLTERKIFYVLTCEYCFSHYVAAFFIAITGFKLLMPNWAGYLIAWFSVVWLANQYMSWYAHWRIDLKKERLKVKQIEKVVKQDTAPSGERPAA